MTHPMDDFQQQVGVWGDKTFPDATNSMIVTHLRDEVNELQTALARRKLEFLTRDAASQETQDTIEEEAADVFLLLLHIAHRNGFSLLDAATVKFTRNTTRNWAHDPEVGYTRHQP